MEYVYFTCMAAVTALAVVAYYWAQKYLSQKSEIKDVDFPVVYWLLDAVAILRSGGVLKIKDGTITLVDGTGGQVLTHPVSKIHATYSANLLMAKRYELWKIGVGSGLPIRYELVFAGSVLSQLSFMRQVKFVKALRTGGEVVDWNLQVATVLLWMRMMMLIHLGLAGVLVVWATMAGGR